MNKLLTFWSMVPFLFLFGCAGKYAVPEGVPQATLHIVTDHKAPTISGWRYYSDSNCTDSSAVMLGGFSQLYDGEARVQIRAAEKGYLLVNTQTPGGAAAYSCGGSICVGSAYCKLEFEMMPIPGRTYRAEHSGNAGNCAVKITDESTGVVTADAKPIEVASSCKQ